MSRKGLEFHIESEEPINYEEFNNNKELIKQLQELCDSEDYGIQIGFDDENILKCNGKIISFTKKECDAEYTVFKGKYQRILKNYYPKIKLIDKMKIYFDKLY